MLAPSLILSFDLVNKTLVPFQGSALQLPDFRQTKYNVRVYIVTPSATQIPGTAVYEVIDYSDYDSLRIGIWNDSTGTLGDAAGFLLALADQLAWTLTADTDGNDCFEGVFNCNTTQMASFIGGAGSAAGFFAVNLTQGADLVNVLDQRGGATNCVINAATDEFSGAAIDVTAVVPLLTLPLQIKDPASGEIYAVTRTSAGVLEFVWINP